MTRQELVDAAKSVPIGQEKYYDFDGITFDNFQEIIDEIEAARTDGGKVKLDRPANLLRVTIEAP